MPDTPNDPQKRVKRSQEPAEQRFNPLRNEEDMFRVVVWVGAICLVLIVVVALARTAF
ncbi:MAG: hypothetical protein ACPGWS_10070 [Solirubrobacterales bacterium]